MTLSQDGNRRTLRLPTAPALTAGDTVEIDSDGAALTISHEGSFVAFASGLVRSGTIAERLGTATEAGSAPLTLGDVELALESVCASSRPHNDPRFCADVGLVSFGLRFGDTLVTAGESVELSHDGRSLAVAVESITRRDDRYSGTCEAACGDYWFPSFDVALVVLPAP